MSIQKKLIPVVPPRMATPCREDPEMWDGENTPDDERDEAARRCLTLCPALELCRELAAVVPDKTGVWAGADYTPGAGKAPAADSVRVDHRFPAKECAVCGKKFLKAKNTSRVTWARTRCCSHRCGAQFRMRPKPEADVAS